MAKTIELFGDIAKEMVRDKWGQPKYTARVLTDREDIDEARKLAIGKFAGLGKISKEEVGDDGLLKFDPFLEKSTFFGVYEGDHEIQAVTRIIWTPDTTVGDMRLPVERIDETEAENLLNAKPGSIAEIGSLAKKDSASNVATLKLLREVFNFAQENGIKDFVCGLEPKLYPTYKRMFGGALRKLKDETIEFPGIEGQQQPLRINVEDALSYNFDTMQARTLGQRTTGLVIRKFFNSGH